MIGEKLGKYTILESLGTGSMGTVYKAEDPDGRIVALKLIRSQVLYDVERRERFLQEILAASLVRHQGICPILEIGDENDDFFIVMPFLEGKTLEQHLERKPLPWRHVLDIAIPIGDAVAAAHAAGAVHRGLKPANVWLRTDGSVVISDCSVARFTEIGKRTLNTRAEPRLDFADTLIPRAALAYMSPEQVCGDIVDLRTDVFSLGTILYEMLTGRHPFDARNSLSQMSAILDADPVPLGSKLGSIPPELNLIVRRALAREPSDRYQSMDDLLADLKRVQQAGDGEPYSPPVANKRRLSTLVLWLAAITLLSALIAATLRFLNLL
ncbi:MAG TPA: serine/threonine-protein kinase [Acidobacteriota bacterium]|nr:serine/threonine-protein kinase [Acidobacteriota bacterium]